MKKRFTVLLTALFPLLTGCASFTGLAAERYDGMRIKRDEEVIDAFQENREILGLEKESYYSEALLEFLSQSALSFPEEEVLVGLNAWEHEVGGDWVPQGRYMVLYEGYFQPDSFIVRDANNQILYQQAMGYSSPSFELNLFDGQMIQGTSTDPIASIVLTNNPPYRPNAGEGEGIVMGNGVWHVGEHLPAGDYRISVPSGYTQYIPHLYLVSPDRSTRLFELLGSSNPAEVLYIDVTLEEGHVFLIENSMPLVFEVVGE